jgi:hypothetical protein
MSEPLATNHSPVTANHAPPVGEPHVPLRRDELIEMLVRLGKLDGSEALEFRRLCKLIAAVFHQRYHEHQERLKQLYAPFDPDAETRPVRQGPNRPRGELLDEFLGTLFEVLTAAHYRPLEPKELEFALTGATYWGLDLQINRDIFDRLLIFVRGDSSMSRVRRDLSTWFRRRVFDLEVYQRLVLVVKMKDSGEDGEPVETDNLFLKMFREIPKLDLEMLLPGTRPRIRLLDAGKIGGSSVTGLYGLFKVFVATLFGKFTWIMIVIGAFSYALQSFLGYRRTKANYLFSLTQQLYYQNLDNNAGVFCRLIDEAEDEEIKEVLLAYYFLWRETDEAWTPDRLVERVDKLIRDQTGDGCQFQARAAIAQLQRLGLMTDSGRVQAHAPAEASRRLADRWREHLSDEFALKVFESESGDGS